MIHDGWLSGRSPVTSARLLKAPLVYLPPPPACLPARPLHHPACALPAVRLFTTLHRLPLCALCRIVRDSATMKKKAYEHRIVPVIITMLWWYRSSGMPRMPTASNIHRHLKIATDLIMFLYSFSFLTNRFAHINRQIQKITTTNTSLKISMNFVGLHCMSSTIPPKHKDVLVECLNLYKRTG